MTRPSDIRRRILKQRKVQLAPHSRKPITHDDAPSSFPKSRLMKYIELKYNDTLEHLISKGTIYEVAKRLDINYTTVSKWRKLIRETEFFGRFEK